VQRPQPNRRLSEKFQDIVNDRFETYKEVEIYLSSKGISFAYTLQGTIILVVDTTLLKKCTKHDMKVVSDRIQKAKIDYTAVKTSHATYKKALEIGLRVLKLIQW
jgi:hypothetical protein